MTTMKSAVPATLAGRCECCSMPYPAGTLILWDPALTGWVLAAHLSLASRNSRTPR